MPMKLVSLCLCFRFRQSRRDEIFIENVAPESSRPIYGRQNGDVAPKGALGFEPFNLL